MRRANVAMYQGDTMEISIEITEVINGEEQPWTPTNETVMFSVGTTNNILFQREVINGKTRIEHEDTQDIAPDTYDFDVRVYDAEYNLVATPLVGKFQIMDVVNHELSQP